MYNFVIYSYNFLPMTDAEAYCSTRFASALARAGHNVTVVTMDWPMQVSESNYRALVAEELKIVRLPFSKHTNNTLKAFFGYGNRSQMAVDIKNSVKAVNKELKSLEHPILITRSQPLMCTIVGNKCRKNASKWIAHFSDPVPWLGYSQTLSNKVLRWMDIRIMRRAFKNSDFVSVTCHYVNRYFEEILPDTFDIKKSVYTPHIGDYRLNAPEDFDTQDKANYIYILHPGTIYKDRGGLAISKALRQLSLEKCGVKLLQIGKVEPSLKEEFASNPDITASDTESLEQNLESIKKARAIFIPDFEVNLTYSPTLLSKFVYQLMGNLPIILYCKKECDMYNYAKRYPEAGIFWAEEGDIESLKHAIKEAVSCNASDIRRDEIRKCFSEEKIVSDFLKAISK